MISELCQPFIVQIARIVTVSRDKVAKVWDAVTGQELMTLTGHDGMVRSAVYSADGQRIVTDSVDKTAKVWDAVTGQELFTLTGHDSGASSPVWSPNGVRMEKGLPLLLKAVSRSTLQTWMNYFR